MRLLVYMLVFNLMLVHVETCFCDYLLVRRSDETSTIGIPTCSHAESSDSTVVLFEGEVVKSLDRCLSLACKSNATVVYFEPDKECIAFKCESNNKNKDWAYKWADAQKTGKRHTGQTYALPHPYIQRCYNSYFMKRFWDRPKGSKSNCFQITTSTMHVDELKKCMTKACKDKANVLNFYELQPDVAQCETKHCGWDSGSEDMDLKIGKVDDRLINTTVHTYTLSHSTSLSSCKSAFWNDAVQMSVKMADCTKWGMFPDTLVKDDQNPPSLCHSGCNVFQSHPGSSMITASACGVNAEGTGWKYYEDQVFDKDSCLVDEEPTDWLNVPYPGTPTCNSTNSIFRLRYLRGQCKMSNCDIRETVHNARDMRQCMIYACEKNYNVINYFSNTSLSICDLRNCTKTDDGDYDFKLSSEPPRGYDIYELHESKQDHSKADISESKFDDQMKEAIVNIDNKTNGLILESMFKDHINEVKELVSSNRNLAIGLYIQTALIAIAIIAVVIYFRVKQVTRATRDKNGQSYNQVLEPTTDR